MDNRIFNVNGSGEEALIKTLRLVFDQQGHNTTAQGYTIDPEKGLVIFWYFPLDLSNPRIIPFLVPLSPEGVAIQAMAWLKTDAAWNIPLDGWDKDSSHDGHNSKGWRVYCENWGHVGEHRGTIAAIKPAYMWHGK